MQDICWATWSNKRITVFMPFILVFGHLRCVFLVQYLSYSSDCKACWLRPMAHLVWDPVLTMANQMPMGNEQAEHEHKSTLLSCHFQLLFRSIAASSCEGTA
ncbi:Hypothetical predicted protein [Podarcis lilfordi]|uniref:Uncharacterized protein n=1 Tax=Podarcis lilfordi TaxID=74358 RepID=A0AA35KRD2_9SAUR|nr:Hypothetical predicted protein [Podarcis lilfordi]